MARPPSPRWSRLPLFHRLLAAAGLALLLAGLAMLVATAGRDAEEAREIQAELAAMLDLTGDLDRVNEAMI